METRHFPGDRRAIRAQAVARALRGMLERLARPADGLPA
jgi:nicotinamide mononucleotide (NMN) deamidase PncC